jgi:hypothetical protein
VGELPLLSSRSSWVDLLRVLLFLSSASTATTTTLLEMVHALLNQTVLF